jgi:hypothetical protein
MDEGPKLDRCRDRRLGRGVPRQLGGEARRFRAPGVGRDRVYSRKYSRRRFVCDRLTGISVDFPSLIFRM